MSAGTKRAQEAKAPLYLKKPTPELPALFAPTGNVLVIKRGMTFGDRHFEVETPVSLPKLQSGVDYVVTVGAKTVSAEPLERPDDARAITCIGGFHFAPGGNAKARAGGDSEPAINPCSLWDSNFRPDCPDPRGMAFVLGRKGGFWVDIYLLGREHIKDGTSKLGVTIADGNDPPAKPDGGYFGGLDYETAVAVMKHHGKQLLSLEEFFAAAYGVTEKTAARRDPKVTGLDAPRTSRSGLMQATGNLWIWGHDGDPDEPRASIFGGSWILGGYAGSRCANVDFWPEGSDEDLGARGRCDHLQLD